MDNDTPQDRFNTVGDFEALMKYVAKRDEPLHPDLEPWVEENERWMMLRHPLVYQIPFDNNGAANEQYEQKLRLLKRAEREDDWSTYVFLHERPHRLNALRTLDNRRALPHRQFWRLARDVWTDSENIWQHLDDWISIFNDPKESRRRARKVMMRHVELAEWERLPEEVTIYRGGDHPGLSWTLDLSVAEWFGDRWKKKGEGRVITGTVHRDDIVAYLSSREANEIIVSGLDVVKNVSLSRRSE